MGKAYQVKCIKCSYEATFCVGVGINDASMAQEAIRDLDNGGYGEQAREFAAISERGEVECQHMLYRCRECGNLETKIKMRIIAESGYSFS